MKPPIFVIGNPRSGTTLLRLMLTCHRNIVIPPECGFAVWLYPNYKTWDAEKRHLFAHDVLQCRKIETWNWQADGLAPFLETRAPQCYADAVALVYEWYGICQGRRVERWGDKNNYYLNHIATLHEMFPAALFVHIVRDGRSVACSYKRLATAQLESPYAPRLPTEVRDIAAEWVRNIGVINAGFRCVGAAQRFEMRFEDLLLAPERTLRAVCRFLDEPYDPEMLDYDKKNRETMLEPAEFAGWKAKTLQPLLTSESQPYLVELTSAERSTFESVASAELMRYGYIQSAQCPSVSHDNR
jgi:hypothetical protein